MNQLSHYFKTGLVATLALLASAVLAGCGLSSSPPTPIPLPTPGDVQLAVVPPPTPTTAPSPTPPPAIIAPDDGCVTCHTDQAMLQETAKPEEVVEALSEGEG